MRRILYRFRFAIAALIVLSFVCLFINYHNQPIDVLPCFIEPPMSNEHNDFERLSDIMLSTIKPTPGRSIFFHETSCHQPLAWQMELTARQACAIESAAKHNPNFSVFVLFASPVYQNKNKTTQTIVDAVQTYSNVHLRNLNLWTYAAGTPLYEWLKDGQLFQSWYAISHISDFLRYLTLWRWGGTYMDMDTITLRSLEELPPNYTGAESQTALAAGVMNFAPLGLGHDVAEQCLLNFQRNFDGRNWGKNGPGVITRVMQSICGTKNINVMMNTERCQGFRVYGPNMFYAIPYVDWTQFFDTNQLEFALKRVENSYVTHVWNNFSKKRRLKLVEHAAYNKLAALHCPRVIAAAGEYF